MSGQIPGQLPEGIANAMYSTMEQANLIAARIARQNAEQLSRQAVFATSRIIMPPLPMLAADSSSAVVGADDMAAPPTAKPTADRPMSIVQRLENVAFFIPRSIREPFFGDLLEDLADMTAKGHTATVVRWAAISQVAMLILRWLWATRLLRR